MRRNSSGRIDVPVGLDGEASNTPCVRSVQLASTCSALSWKRVCGPDGTSRATPSKAATKWRLHG